MTSEGNQIIILVGNLHTFPSIKMSSFLVFLSYTISGDRLWRLLSQDWKFCQWIRCFVYPCHMIYYRRHIFYYGIYLVACVCFAFLCFLQYVSCLHSYTTIVMMAQPYHLQVWYSTPMLTTTCTVWNRSLPCILSTVWVSWETGWIKRMQGKAIHCKEIKSAAIHTYQLRKWK
jgi:hypothetical protein